MATIRGRGCGFYSNKYGSQLNNIIIHCVFQPYLLLPADADLLAMAFEWVGMDLYYMLRDQQNNLRIMRVSTINRDVLAPVGPMLQEQVSPADKIKMVVDPFGG